MAKRWPDELEADMRRCTGVRWPYLLKPKTCTQRCGVYPDRHKRESGCAIPRGDLTVVPAKATSGNATPVRSHFLGEQLPLSTGRDCTAGGG